MNKKLLTLATTTLIFISNCLAADVRLSGGFAAQLNSKYDSFSVEFSNGTQVILNEKNNYKCDIDNKQIKRFVLKYKLEKHHIDGYSTQQLNMVITNIFRDFTKIEPIHCITSLISEFATYEITEFEIPSSANEDEIFPNNWYIIVKGTIHRDGREPEITLPFQH